MRRQSAILSVVFGRSGIVIGELRRVDIVGMGEELYWLGDITEIIFCNIMNMLEL